MKKTSGWEETSEKDRIRDGDFIVIQNTGKLIGTDVIFPTISLAFLHILLIYQFIYLRMKYRYGVRETIQIASRISLSLCLLIELVLFSPKSVMPDHPIFIGGVSNIVIVPTFLPLAALPARLISPLLLTSAV